jgi:hypothetical protein
MSAWSGNLRRKPGAQDGAVGWGASLEYRGLWVRFPMGSLDFSLTLSWGRLNREYLLRGKGGRCVGLTILLRACADCLVNLGAPSFWNPRACSGLSRHLPSITPVFRNNSDCRQDFATTENVVRRTYEGANWTYFQNSVCIWFYQKTVQAAGTRNVRTEMYGTLDKAQNSTGQTKGVTLWRSSTRLFNWLSWRSSNSWVRWGTICCTRHCLTATVRSVLRIAFISISYMCT